MYPEYSLPSQSPRFPAQETVRILDISQRHIANWLHPLQVSSLPLAHQTCLCKVITSFKFMVDFSHDVWFRDELYVFFVQYLVLDLSSQIIWDSNLVLILSNQKILLAQRCSQYIQNLISSHHLFYCCSTPSHCHLIPGLLQSLCCRLNVCAQLKTVET